MKTDSVLHFGLARDCQENALWGETVSRSGTPSIQAVLLSRDDGRGCRGRSGKRASEIPPQGLFLAAKPRFRENAAPAAAVPAP